jgi:predicted HicB family RNase H-like nuclease
MGVSFRRLASLLSVRSIVSSNRSSDLRRNPTAIISYSHDSPDHKNRVLSLCNSLRRDGIDCTIDQFVTSPPEGWPRWMMNTIGSVDFVLVVATQKYLKRFEATEPGEGNGVAFEGVIITHELYQQKCRNTRFVPIVFDTTDCPHIPIILQGATYYNVMNRVNYRELVAHLTGQPLLTIPVTGPISRITPKAVSHLHDDSESASCDDSNNGEECLEADDHIENCDRGDVATAVITERCKVELTLDRNFDEFTDEDQDEVVSALKHLLNISDDIRVVQRTRGSVKLTLDMPIESYEVIREAIELGYLDELKATGIKRRGPDDQTLEDLWASEWKEPAGEATPKFGSDRISKYQQLLHVSERLFQQSPDWVVFFREVMGIDGVIRREFQSLDDLTAFERSEEFVQIQKMLVALRANKATAESESEPTRVLTVRLPKSMHEYLRTEAHDLRTSINKLCISKLLQMIERDMIPSDQTALPSSSLDRNVE